MDLVERLERGCTTRLGKGREGVKKKKKSNVCVPPERRSMLTWKKPQAVLEPIIRRVSPEKQAQRLRVPGPR